MDMDWHSTPFCILMALSISCSWFELLVGFLFSVRGRFSWGPPFCCFASTKLWNVDTASYMLFYILWNLTVLFLSSLRNLLLSWVMSLSITVCYTWEFRRLATSRNTAANLADNELGPTGFWYSSTPFQSRKGMSYSSSVPHDRTDEYKSSIFSGFAASPPSVGNTNFSFILLLFSSPTVSTVFTSSEILDGDLPAPQCWPGIWCWWDTVFFSSTLLFLILFSCFPWIENGNETESPYGILGASLDLCRTIISSLNFSPRSLLIKAFLLLLIEALIVFRNGHENMVLHATHSPREMETVTGFWFTTKVVS